MALDFGEVLTRAWKITWKHKILWAFGFVSMLLGFLFIPLGFAPAISLLFSEDVPIWIEEPVYIFVFIGFFIVLFIVSFFVSPLMQAAISLGVVYADRAPLQLLLYPLMFVAYAWYEQALAAVVVDGLGVFEAAQRGWQVFRKNLLPVILMTLIMYLGIGMISAFASLPLMAPLFASFFAVMESLEGSRTIFMISALCATVYLPVLAVLQSIALTFMKSGWLLTYLRLTRNPETDLIVSPVA